VSYLLFVLYVRLADQKPSDAEQLRMDRLEYGLGAVYRLLIGEPDLRNQMLKDYAKRRALFRDLSASVRIDVANMARSGQLGIRGILAVPVFLLCYYVLRLKSMAYTNYLDLFVLLGLGVTVFRGLKE